MTRRKYTIEASIGTLNRFTQVVASHGHSAGFVEKLTVSAGDEYYYIVLYAPEPIHAALKGQRFDNSHAVGVPKGRVQ